jgi:hypothetical protein
MARSISSPVIVRFQTDAPVFELSGIAVNGSMTCQTLMVDGQLVPPKVLSSCFGAGGGYAVGTIRVDFGSRALRDIYLETAMALAYVTINSGDTLEAVSSLSEPQMTVVGDSYQGVRSAAFGNSSAIGLELGARLGIRNVAVDAVGGTGYWNSGNDIGNLNDRLPAHAADNSQIYVIMAGLNDYGDLTGGTLVWPSPAVYQQSVTGYVQGLRAAQPNAVIVVAAPFCPVPPMSDSTYIASSATNNSGIGDFLYKAQLHKQAVEQIAGPWIYIDVLMGTGWVNSSGATGGATGLQWFTGGTPAGGTTASDKPGNTTGGGGGGFGALNGIPVISGGSYVQAPDITAQYGSGSGLLVASTINSTGQLTSVDIVTQGAGYTASGLPSFVIDPTFQISTATIGTPSLMMGINPDGEYPLPSFAPPDVPVWDLNNIYVMLENDTVHPSQVGASYLSARLARSIYDAVLAL